MFMRFSVSVREEARLPCVIAQSAISNEKKIAAAADF